MTNYFDHAECPHCGARFDPEQIGGKKGEATCPACGGDLGIKGIFGVSDSFVGLGDDEGRGLTLDDLVGRVENVDHSGYGDQVPTAQPLRRKQPRQITQRAAGKVAGKPAASAAPKPAPKAAPPAPPARSAVLDGEGPTGSDALDALKSLKKK